MKRVLIIFLIIMIALITNAGITLAARAAPDLNPVDALQIIDKQITDLSTSAFNNAQTCR